MTLENQKKIEELYKRKCRTPMEIKAVIDEINELRAPELTEAEKRIIQKECRERK